MATRSETAIPIDSLTVHRRARGTIAVVGNPNAGKSSVFNRLTGLRQSTANYPGVTVERREWAGTTHEFFGADALIPAAAEAQQWAGQRLRDALWGTTPVPSPGGPGERG